MKTHPDHPISNGKYTTATKTAENITSFEYIEFCGLTKREYFAAMALQGILANGGDIYPICAEQAVIAADALIASLNQPAHTETGKDGER